MVLCKNCGSECKISEFPSEIAINPVGIEFDRYSQLPNSDFPVAAKISIRTIAIALQRISNSKPVYCKMNILAIDTSLEFCAVAIKNGKSSNLTSAISEEIGKGHAERLPDMLGEALLKAQIEIDSVERIGVTVGPGSFTGMRIGISMAKGLAMVRRIPIVGISTLKAIAMEAFSEIECASVLVLLNARRSDYFVQQFNRDGSSMEEVRILNLEQIESMLANDSVLAGSGATEVASRFGAKRRIRIANRRPAPDISFVCELVALAKEPFKVPTPIYAKPADVKPQAESPVLKK